MSTAHPTVQTVRFAVAAIGVAVTPIPQPPSGTEVEVRYCRVS